MPHLRQVSGAAALAAVLLIAPSVLADSPAAVAKPRFDEFCATWMAKLQAREQGNAENAQVERRGERFVIEYTGYSSRPMRCESRPTGVAENPYVGKLLYHELRYEKAGAERASARAAEPSVVATTEILEIFRFDGTRWVY